MRHHCAFTRDPGSGHLRSTLSRARDAPLDRIRRIAEPGRGASQSGLAPDCFTIGAQRWTSSRTKAANSAALLPTGMGAAPERHNGAA
jgi:hypothetical protein